MTESFVKIPTEILEALYALDLKRSHMKVLIYISRKTFGWRKTSDRISVNSMAANIGLTKRSVIMAINELEAAQIISVERAAGRPSRMEIRPAKDWQGVKPTSPVKHTSPVKPTSPVGVNYTSPVGVKPTSPTTDTITDTLQIKDRASQWDDVFTPEEEAALEAEGWGFD